MGSSIVIVADISMSMPTAANAFVIEGQTAAAVFSATRFRLVWMDSRTDMFEVVQLFHRSVTQELC